MRKGGGCRALQASLTSWCSTGRATQPPALFYCLASLQKQKFLPPYSWGALFHRMSRDEVEAPRCDLEGTGQSLLKRLSVFIISKVADLLSLSKHGGICGSGMRRRQNSQHLSPSAESLVKVRTREVEDSNSKIVMAHHPSCPHQPHHLSAQAVCQGRGSSSLASMLPSPHPLHEKKERRDNA